MVTAFGAGRPAGRPPATGAETAGAEAAWAETVGPGPGPGSGPPGAESGPARPAVLLRAGPVGVRTGTRGREDQPSAMPG
ncbi:hypothetical protein Kpho02_34090 [Kitasatospora phosalacinea]|uniref:Uncharacterized protein n=1 Tax=Kitasatospora phosalacinea TaxID=2065 RepID=A0A9W6Q731_9ACTN|nr:hypothetical protein Kpho02_34090 [Kitasatospora phosalacinea]